MAEYKSIRSQINGCLALPLLCSEDDTIALEIDCNCLLASIGTFFAIRNDILVVLCLRDATYYPELILNKLRCFADTFQNFRLLVYKTGSIANLRDETAQLDSAAAAAALAIVNISNSRFSPQGGYLNQLLHRAAGQEFRQLCLQQHETSTRSRGGVFVVVLPETNILRMQSGYSLVINVIPPTLNTTKDECCKSMEEAATAVALCYSQIFQSFAEICHVLPASNELKRQNELEDDGVDVDDVTATDIRSNPLKRATGPSINPSLGDFPYIEGGCSTSNFPLEIPSYQPPMCGTAASSMQGMQFSRDLLYRYIDQPDKFRPNIYYRTDFCTVVYDQFPKARIHLLVLPHRDFLRSNGCVDLSPASLPALRRMHDLGKRLCASKQLIGAASATLLSSGAHEARQLMGRTGHPQPALAMGYHSVPSLRPLHLHVFSTDLCSEFLKTKKHWNSFASDFLLPADLLESWLEAGKTVREMLSPEPVLEAKLKQPMRCNRCHAPLPTIPALKAHQETCG